MKSNKGAEFRKKIPYRICADNILSSLWSSLLHSKEHMDTMKPLLMFIVAASFCVRANGLQCYHCSFGQCMPENVTIVDCAPGQDTCQIIYKEAQYSSMVYNY
ncbi:hypothetical protein NDU88_004256 [Pleurodeles waltl]|uniref:Uncharacterized protein n=1 Tax=Pleurodeles waltl TaxID=8319 RepID=A0AAV7PG48_PLEWA|nr:hypothetical protein NDU88_004256 [Pleurodeles waltl]